MKRQRGGQMWDQGDDGCIFYPRVACVGEKVPLSSDPNFVSKIVPAKSLDLDVEMFLRKYFLHVVSKKGVLIARNNCVPQFVAEDWIPSPKLAEKLVSSKYGACHGLLAVKTPELYQNLLYEKYDDTYFHAIQQEPFLSNHTKCLLLLRHALNAAVALVPDSGPWVLHIDLQVNNIFVKLAKRYSSLADWGRCCIIENPNDQTSITKGLTTLLEKLKTKITVKRKFIEDYTGYPELPQFPIVIRKAYDILLNAKAIDIDARNLLRLTSIYGVLNSLVDKVNKEEALKDTLKMTLNPILQGIINELLQPDGRSIPTSQQDIINKLNEKLGKDYIDIPSLFPMAVPVGSASGAGAGQKLGGTRTTRRKIKRRRTTRSSHRFNYLKS